MATPALAMELTRDGPAGEARRPGLCERRSNIAPPLIPRAVAVMCELRFPTLTRDAQLGQALFQGRDAGVGGARADDAERIELLQGGQFL